jgi:Xaa-Pro aminopeptidase
MPDIVKAFCAKYRVVSPVVPRTVTAGAWELVRRACPKARLAARGEEVFPKRMVKQQHELRAIKAMTLATEDAITVVRDALADARIRNGIAYRGNKPLTSEALKRVAATALAQHNASCPDMIIASGKQGALPHEGGSGLVKEGSVIVDIFPQSHETGYYSDMTRTFVIGDAPKTFEERYAAVIAVYAASRKAVKHGAKNVENVAKDTFTRLGVKTDLAEGTGYIHSLGHGVGLNIHEEPRLSQRLVAGNVITIEPGLYYDYGIRVEDIGLVTKRGFTNFSKLKKEPYL